MGKLMKFLYSLMLIVLILLGALFLALGIDINNFANTLMEVELLRDLISNEVFVKGFFISIIYKVGCCNMSPNYIFSTCIKWIVLKINMVFSIKLTKTIGII